MNLREVTREFRELPLAAIDAPALPSRSQMDEERMDELVASIRELGLIQPISVARVGDRYEVIAGHRRRIAAERAGLAAIPCVVYPSSALSLEAIKVDENARREDWNPADEAIYFNELLETRCDGDVDRLCDAVKRKRAYVEGRLLLFQGDEVVFEQLRAGKIAIGIAHELNRCTDQAHRRMFLDQAIRGGATVAVVRGWIEDWKRYAIHLDGQPAAATTPAPLAPIPETNFFTCYVCRGTDNVHTMRPVNIHTHCELAILKPALEHYERRGQQLRFPRTVDEATDVVAEILEAFPQLTAQ